MKSGWTTTEDIDGNISIVVKVSYHDLVKMSRRKHLKLIRICKMMEDWFRCIDSS